MASAQSEMSSFVTNDIGIAESTKMKEGFSRFAVQDYKPYTRGGDEDFLKNENLSKGRTAFNIICKKHGI